MRLFLVRIGKTPNLLQERGPIVQKFQTAVGKAIINTLFLKYGIIEGYQLLLAVANISLDKKVEVTRSK